MYNTISRSYYRFLSITFIVYYVTFLRFEVFFYFSQLFKSGKKPR